MKMINKKINIKRIIIALIIIVVVILIILNVHDIVQGFKDGFNAR